MTASVHARTWVQASTAFFAVLALTLAAYQETVASFVRTWAHSETYAHGFLILPIAGYLIWMKRHELAANEPRPYPPALPILPILGVAWLAGRATSTVLVEEFSLVAFLPTLALVCFGPQVVRTIAFPLAFLFFCIPFGDAFQPPLMNVTADIAAYALRLSGVPVAREGLFLATPAAQWRVAEACSGLQFLVSGFALACLFAYMTYRSNWKRLACAGASIVVLILANGVRAYVLILAGYLTDMRVGRGFEHYAFGWVVYIVVMISFFAVGSAYRDKAPPESRTPRPGARLPRTPDPAPARPSRWMSMAGAAGVLLWIWPVLFFYLSRPIPGIPGVPIASPAPLGGWVAETDTLLAWQPTFAGAASEAIRVYKKGDATVQCYLAFYERQGNGRELIQNHNVIARSDDPRWRKMGERTKRIRLVEKTLTVQETDIRGPDARFVVWNWYWFPDQFTTSPEWAKVLQARASLVLHRDHAAVVVLSVPAADAPKADEDLKQFVADMLPSIRLALDRADTRP